MLINNKWKIESDELNVCLYKRRISKKGKENWVCQGYYSNVANALEALIDLKINGTGLTDLEKVNEEIEGLKRDIRLALQTLPKNTRIAIATE